MKEQKIQSNIIKKLEEKGWLCNKIIKMSKNGFPDIIAHRNGETIYIEVKKEKGILSELQKLRIRQLKEKGITVKVWKNYETDF